MFKVVRARMEHAEQVAPLFDQYRQFYKQRSDPAGALKFISRRLENDESIIFLALDDVAGPVGFTQLYPSFSSTSMVRLWILNDLFVLPNVRKQGVARALMEQARHWAVETGAEGLALETAIDNYNAQRLYEDLGYKKDEAFFRYNLVVR